MQTIVNNIGYVTKYSPNAWDEVYQFDSRASLLSNKGLVNTRDVNGARTVKVAKKTYGGLAPYARNNIQDGAAEGLGYHGYKQAAQSLVWEERTLSQDVAAAYPIELMDNDESLGLAVATTTADVSKQVVIPDVDAYCFSHICEEVKRLNPANYKSGAFTTGKYLEELNMAFFALESENVESENQIVFVSTAYFNALRSTPELYRKLDSEGDVGKKVSFKIVGYEGRPLVVCPPQRFREGFTRRADGGFRFTGSDIDFICLDRDAAIHITKYQKTKVLTGDAALAYSGMDSVVIFVRIYHDVFVFDNKAKGIYVHVGGFTNEAGKPNFNFAIDGNGVLTNTLESPVGTLTRYYATTKTLTTANINDAWVTEKAKDTPILVGDTFSAGTKTVVGVQGGEIIGVKTLTVSGTAPNITFTLTDKAS